MNGNVRPGRGPAGLILMLVAALTVAPADVIAQNASEAEQDSSLTPKGNEPVGFGMDAGSVDTQIAAGVPPDAATIWLGPWTLQHGWRDTDRMLMRLRELDITPVIHYYYWGDDLTPDCLEHGCWSSLHDTRKDRASWDLLAQETVEHIQQQMEGEPVIILLETEFNQAEVSRHEPLDAALAEKARMFRAQYPAATLVMPLGNWNPPAWSTWDRTAAEVDLVGVQALRASTRHDEQQYLSAFQATVHGLEEARKTFGKPTLVHDIGLSSHPDERFVDHQAQALSRFFDGMDDLQAQDVRLLLYRAWYDDPRMDADNYFGIAERHWGVAEKHVVTPKPAAQVWIDGVRDARGLPSLDISTRLPQLNVALDQDARLTSARPTPPADQPPMPDVRVAAEDGRVVLDASPTVDPEGHAPGFTWRIDGRQVSTAVATEQRLAAGTYDVELVVRSGNHTVWQQWDLQVGSTADDDGARTTTLTTVLVLALFTAAIAGYTIWRRKNGA